MRYNSIKGTNPMNTEFMILDGSNLLHRALHVPQLMELKTRSTGIRTGGIFSVLNTMIMYTRNFGCFPLMVFDKGLSKRRLKIHPNYKYTIDKFGERSKNEFESKEQDEYLAEYGKQRAALIDILNMMGIPVFMVQDVEGDDIMGYMIAKMPEITLLVSEDKDMYQLLDKVDIYRPIRKQFISLNPVPDDAKKLLKIEEYTSLQEMGYDDCGHYLVTKAILGDGSDNVPGITGVGGTNAVKIAKKYLDDPLTWLKTMKTQTDGTEYDNLDELLAFQSKIDRCGRDKELAAQLMAKIKPENYDAWSKKRPGNAYERKFLSQYETFLMAMSLIDIYAEDIDDETKRILQAEMDIAAAKTMDIFSVMDKFSYYEFNSLTQKIGDFNMTLVGMKDAAFRILREKICV